MSSAATVILPAIHLTADCDCIGLYFGRIRTAIQNSNLMALGSVHVGMRGADIQGKSVDKIQVERHVPTYANHKEYQRRFSYSLYP